MTGQRVFLCTCGTEPKLKSGAYGSRCKSQKERIWRWERMFRQGDITEDMLAEKKEAILNPESLALKEPGKVPGRTRNPICPKCKKREKVTSYCRKCASIAATECYRKRATREGRVPRDGFTCASTQSVMRSLDKFFGSTWGLIDDNDESGD